MEQLIDRDYYALKDIAEYYGMSERTVRRWVDAGDLPAVLVGGSLRIPRNSLYAFDAKVRASRPRKRTKGTASSIHSTITMTTGMTPAIPLPPVEEARRRTSAKN